MDNYNDKDVNKQWTDISRPTVQPLSEAESVSKESTNPKSSISQKNISPIITFQLIVCILILILIFISKPLIPKLNQFIMNIYNAEISASMIFSGDFKDLDYSSFFGATEDEI